MAEEPVDVLERALQEIRDRYQRLEGRVRSLERGTVKLPPAEAPQSP